MKTQRICVKLVADPEKKKKKKKKKKPQTVTCIQRLRN